MQNRVVLGGQVVRTDATRYSPAGIPIRRFVLEHRSAQREAGQPREARCRLLVMVCGHDLQPLVADLQPGTNVQVTGFLSRADNRLGETRLVLHATQIEPMPIES